jgi:hypothetical protein
MMHHLRRWSLYLLSPSTIAIAYLILVAVTVTVTVTVILADGV